MFREMRRKDRSLNKDQIDELMLKGEYGILSVLNENGYAYGLPLNYAYVDGAIYFHSAQDGEKLDSISMNPKVSFSVVGETEIVPEKFTANFESVIAFGMASLIIGDEKKDALKLLIKKYSPEFVQEGDEYIDRAINETAVVKIEIEHICGKARK